MTDLRWIRTAERPDLKLWLEDDDGTLIDFSSGYTFVFKIGHTGDAAVFTKSTAITGAAGSATVPNVVLTFTSGEMDSIEANRYDWQLRATTANVDRLFQGVIVFSEVIT